MRICAYTLSSGAMSSGKWAKSVVREERGQGVWLDETAPAPSDANKKLRTNTTGSLSQPVQAAPQPARTSSPQSKPFAEHSSAGRGLRPESPAATGADEADPAHVSATASGEPALASAAEQASHTTHTTPRSIFSVTWMIKRGTNRDESERSKQFVGSHIKARPVASQRGVVRCDARVATLPDGMGS